MSEQLTAEQSVTGTPAPVPVTFRVSTYWKRRRNEPGLTSLASERLVASQVLEWVLNEFPEEAVTINHDLATDVATITIDWTKVPGEVRYGKRSA
jgi:hypothetical protein